MFDIQWDTEGLENIDAITTKGASIHIRTTGDQNITVGADRKWGPVGVEGQDALEARWTYSFFLPPLILFTMLRTGEYDFMQIKPSCLAGHARHGLWPQAAIAAYLLAIWAFTVMTTPGYKFATNHAILPLVSVAIPLVLYLVREGSLWMLGGGLYALGAVMVGLQLYNQRSMDTYTFLVGWGFVALLLVAWVFTNFAGKLLNINNLNKMAALRRRPTQP